MIATWGRARPVAVAGRGVARPRWVEQGWPGLPLGAGLPCQGVRLWTDITRPAVGPSWHSESAVQML